VMLRQPGDGFENLVADVMAEAFVNQLEVVEIEQHHRNARRTPLGPGKRLTEPVEKQRPVGHARERVVECLTDE
jgi:hypothetical protein